MVQKRTFFKFTLVYPSKKGAFLYFSNMAKTHLFVSLQNFKYLLFYVKSIRIGVTSRSALGFMAHAGPQRRGIVREHFVAKRFLKQKKSTVKHWIDQTKMSCNSNHNPRGWVLWLSHISHFRNHAVYIYMYGLKCSIPAYLIVLCRFSI